MKLFIYQGNDNDCGFTSLKMLLANLSKDKSYLYISKPFKKSSFTLSDIEKIAEDFDVKLESYSCDEEYINKIKTPCLALINTNHMVMIKNKTKNSLLIYDPGLGIRKMKIKDFLVLWSKIIMEVVDYKNITKIKRIRRNVLPIRFEIIQTLISILSVACLLVSFYFFSNSSSLLYSFIFLILFIASQILENSYLRIQLDYFDEHYIKLFFDDKKSRNLSNYEKFTDFKKNYFIFNRSLLSSILIAFSITFLLCFNDFRNILVIILLLLFKLFELLVFNNSNQDINEKISNLEQESFKDVDSSIVNLVKANKCANKQVLSTSFRNLIFIVLCFLLSIMMMVLTNNFSSNFVIFHFLIYFVSFKSYSDLVEKISNNSNLEKQKSRFLDQCNL